MMQNPENTALTTAIFVGLPIALSWARAEWNSARLRREQRAGRVAQVEMMVDVAADLKAHTIEAKKTASSESLEKNTKITERIANELIPNHGSSLFDKIEAMGKSLRTHSEDVDRKLGENARQNETIIGSLDRAAVAVEKF